MSKLSELRDEIRFKSNSHSPVEGMGVLDDAIRMCVRAIYAEIADKLQAALDADVAHYLAGREGK